MESCNRLRASKQQMRVIFCHFISCIGKTFQPIGSHQPTTYWKYSKEKENEKTIQRSKSLLNDMTQSHISTFVFINFDLILCQSNLFFIRDFSRIFHVLLCLMVLVEWYVEVISGQNSWNEKTWFLWNF